MNVSEADLFGSVDVVRVHVTTIVVAIKSKFVSSFVFTVMAPVAALIPVTMFPIAD